MEASPQTSHAKKPARQPFVRSLDDLARLTTEELADIYARGTVPDSLVVLDGDLVGRMLAVRGTGRGALFRAIASFAGSAAFPWGGKSFRAKDSAHGTGINRLRLGARGGRHRVFPFATRLGASVTDDRPCVVLDYDDPDNPPMIRAIHDEVREIAPRLFLGPACMKRKSGKPATILWFALDAGAN